MARVPTSGTTRGQIPITSQSTLGTGIGRAIGQAAGTAAGIAGQLQQQSRERAAEAEEFEQRRQDQLARDEADNAFSELSRGVDDLALTAESSQEISEMTPGFTKGADKLRQDALKGLSSDAARNRFGPRALNLVDARRVSVNAKQHKREGRAGVQSLRENLDTAQDSIITASSPAESEEQTRFALDMIDTSEWIFDEARAGEKEAFLAGIDAKAIARLVDLADSSDDEEEALGHLAVANEMLSGEGGTPHLSSKQRTAMRRAVKSELQDSIQRFNREKVRRLGQAVDGAETAKDVLEAEAGIENLFQAGALTPGGAGVLERRLRSRLAVMATVDEGGARVELAIASGSSLDPADQTSFDAWYKEKFLPETQDMTPEERNDEIVELIRNTDLIPDAVESVMRSAANEDDPEKVADIAQMFITLREASPQATKRIDRPTAAFLENIDRAVSIGISVEQALLDSREISKTDPGIIKDREIAYRNNQLEETDENWLIGKAETGFFSDSPFKLVRPFALDVTADAFDAGMLSMFASEVERQFKLDPDISRSRGRAFQHMSRVVGVTDIGGDPRVAYAPPELMYNFDGDSEEIQSQLIVDMHSINVPELDGLTDDQLRDRLILSADKDSLREFDDATGYLQPGYNVFLLSDDEFSRPELLLHGPTVKPLPGFVKFPSAHPLTPNEEGGISNVVLMSVTFGDKTIAIPTMVDGKQLSNDEAVKTARREGLEKFPTFDSVDEAEIWIQANHGNVQPDGTVIEADLEAFTPIRFYPEDGAREDRELKQRTLEAREEHQQFKAAEARSLEREKRFEESSKELREMQGGGTPVTFRQKGVLGEEIREIGRGVLTAARKFSAEQLAPRQRPVTAQAGRMRGETEPEFVARTGASDNTKGRVAGNGHANGNGG